MRYTYNDDPRASVRRLWFTIAKERAKRGDHQGAAQARRSAHAIPTVKAMRRYCPDRYAR